jgi:hypothetical protein
LNITQKKALERFRCLIQSNEHFFWAEDHQRLPEVSVLKPERMYWYSTWFNSMALSQMCISSHQNWF